MRSDIFSFYSDLSNILTIRQGLRQEFCLDVQKISRGPLAEVSSKKSLICSKCLT